MTTYFSPMCAVVFSLELLLWCMMYMLAISVTSYRACSSNSALVSLKMAAF